MTAEMSRRQADTRARQWGAVLGFWMGMAVGNAVLSAAVINVPADKPTIGEAITAAAAGDTVLVAPGTYTEAVIVGKADLILRSSAGAATTTIALNAVDTPVVDITAPGVTLGGPGQGFTIAQQHPGPASSSHGGNCAIRIRGELASVDTVRTTLTIEGCALTGNQSDEGLLVNRNLTNAHLVVKDCTIGKNGGTFGVRYGMYFSHSNPGEDLDEEVCANEDTIDLLGVTATDFDAAGIKFRENLHKSTVNIIGGSYTGTSNAGEGLYINGDVTNFSAVNVTGAAFGSVENGIDVHEVVNQSSVILNGLTITGFHGTGVAIGSTYYSSKLQVLNSTLSGDGVNAMRGISSDTEYDSTLLVDGCTISGVAEYGVTESYPYSGASATITNNQISMYVRGGVQGTGISTDTEYNSALVIRSNTISGFNYVGIYDDDSYAGCSVIIDANTLTADAAGSDYGIYSYGPEYGSETLITNNVASNFDYAGIYLDYSNYGSSATVSGNTLTALAAGADYGLYFGELYAQGAAQVNNNSASGFTSAGLYVEDIYEGSELAAAGNVLTAHASGADYGVYTSDIYEGGGASFTVNQVRGWSGDGFYNEEVYEGGRLTLAGNTFSTDIAKTGSGFYSDYGFEDGATVVLTGNTFSGFTDTGFYCDYPAYDGSLLTLTGNTFAGRVAGAAEGIHFDSYADYGSVVRVSNNTITNFTDYGIYVYGLDDGSDMVIHNNLLTAMAGGISDQYGIYYDNQTDYGSTNEVSGNTITGIADPDGAGGSSAYGIYMEGATDGSIERVSDNIVTGTPADGSITYGIYCNYIADYGSTFEVTRNRVSGFTDSALYFNDDTDQGGRLRCEDNDLTGGKYGMFYASGYEISAGSSVWIQRNVVRDFTVDGFYMTEQVWGSKVLFHLNRFAGTAAAHGVFFNDTINSGAEITFTDNCFGGVNTGIRVSDILDTSFVAAHQNDFSATTLGIENVSGDAAHVINAENNFFAGATHSAGNVDTDPALAAPPDEDADGVIDCSDNCPATPAGQTVDANGCSCLQLHPTADGDSDGTLDCNDACPADPAKVVAGVCGCGNPDTDTDADGTPDCADGCAGDPAKTAPGLCGCGTSDLDSDGDGTPNCTDGCPSDGGKLAAGVCGCGVADTDTDGDGTLNCADACPADPGKTAAGVCGCGVADTDRDGDGVRDCVDQCPDEAGTAENQGCVTPASGQPIPTNEAPACGAGLCGAGGATLLPLTLLGLMAMRRRFV